MRFPLLLVFFSYNKYIMKDIINIYSLLICFFIFIFIKKIYDIAIIYKYPTFEDIDKQDSSLDFIFLFKDILSVTAIIFILYILFSFKVNNFIFTVVILIFIHNILYFLIDKRYIYYFVDKKNIDMDQLIFIDGTINNIANVLVLLYTIYILIQIFRTS